MSTVEGGVIRQLSVSQAESFDATQVGGCPRRWYFERVEGRRVEQDEAQTDGDVGHALLAMHLRGEPLPKRSRMLKAVQGAIAAGKLPKPGPHLLVETRFDGQPKHAPDGAYLPVDVAKTLRLGGIPWDGYVDLRYRRDDGVVAVVDHKFSSDIHQYAKANDALLATVQMPVYALDSLRIWPDADRFLLAHHYVSRRGVESFVRGQVVTVGQVRARVLAVEQLVERMKEVARAARQDDVPFNRRACDAYRGCPHQSVCKAYKSKERTVSMDDLLSDEDRELFGMAPKGKPTQNPEELKTLAKEAEERADETGDGGDIAMAQSLAAAAVDVPLPVASKPAPQPPPACSDCGTELSSANGSRLTSGQWKHIGCPAAAPASEAPKRRGRPPKAKPADEFPQGKEVCNLCGEMGATTLPASKLQTHTTCKGAPTGAAPSEPLTGTPPYTPVLVDGPRVDARRVPEADATPPPAPTETTAAGPGGQDSSRLHEYMERRGAEDRRRAFEKWNSGGMDGPGAPLFDPPLPRVIRLEVDVSDRVFPLLERLVGVLVRPR